MTVIIISAIAILIVSAILINMQPDEFRTTRSAKLNAPPSAIFPWLNSQKKGAEWSPWVQMDPNADYMYEGPDSGIGAKSSWKGKNVGEGSLTVTNVIPDERIVCRLEFTKPMKCENTVEYILEPANDGTNVTWTMYGRNTFISKAMNIVMNCEKMCGDQFEKGLQNLKQKVEG